MLAKLKVGPLTMAVLSPLFKTLQGLANTYTLRVYVQSTRKLHVCALATSIYCLCVVDRSIS